ncbi:MAG TPA: glutathione S-transferase [Caulobacteraceae bacterium]|jgi:glutathione S-transferase|nr:glutathione S-transferase [Caulobacteraceae bacterium]
MSTPSLTLIYFPFGGRAAPIRDALRIGGVAFEDKHVDFDAFGAMKTSGELPFGAVPILQVDGKTISQSTAILRYAGKRSGLYPSDPLLALRVDEAMDGVDDMMAPMGASIREEDAERKAALRKDMAENTIPANFARFEKLIRDNGSTGFLVGDSLTIADLKLLHSVNKLTDGSLDGIPPSVIEPFPALKQWRDNVTAVREKRLEPVAA